MPPFNWLSAAATPYADEDATYDAAYADAMMPYTIHASELITP